MNLTSPFTKSCWTFRWPSRTSSMVHVSEISLDILNNDFLQSEVRPSFTSLFLQQYFFHNSITSSVFQLLQCAFRINVFYNSSTNICWIFKSILYCSVFFFLAKIPQWIIYIDKRLPFLDQCWYTFGILAGKMHQLNIWVPQYDFT